MVGKSSINPSIHFVNEFISFNVGTGLAPTEPAEGEPMKKSRPKTYPYVRGSFIPVSDETAIRSAVMAFKKDCLKPTEYGFLAQEGGVLLVAVAHINVDRRPDIADLPRVMAQETTDGLDIRTEWAYLLDPEPGSICLARLEIEVTAPVHTTIKILFNLNSPKDQAFLKGLLKCLRPGLSLKLSGQGLDKAIGFDFEVGSLAASLAGLDHSRRERKGAVAGEGGSGFGNL